LPTCWGNTIFPYNKIFFLGGAIFPEGPRFKKRYNREKNASIWRIFLMGPEGKMTSNKVIKDCAWRIKS
jgi:hypothetical protein